MGANDREHDRRTEQRARREEGRAKGKLDRLRRVREKSGAYDLESVEWDAVIAFIFTIARAGGATRVGLTRDRGALAIGIYLDEDYVTEYIRPGESVQDVLDGYLVALGLQQLEE